MDTNALIGASPWVIITAAATWIGQAWLYSDKRSERREQRKEKLEADQHDLTFDLLKAAREEVAAARLEILNLRDEISTLRAIEQHYYHYQQALGHIEALLFGPAEDRARTERNAKAFLNRMRRLAEAEGTLRNEVQLADSIVELKAGEIRNVGNQPAKPESGTDEQ